MSFLGKMFGWFGGGFVRPWTVRAPDHELINGPGSMQDAEGEGGVLSLSAAWACCNLLAGTVATLPVAVYRETAEGVLGPAKDHPLYRILHDSPNFDQTAVDFWEFVQLSLELRGNSYAVIGREGGRVRSLTPIRPDLVKVDRNEAGALRYTWTEDGRRHVMLETEIFHIRGFGGSPLGGLSTLAHGARTFGLAMDINTAARNTFRNGLRPSGTLTFEKWLTQEQRDLAENKLAAKFAGAINAGKPLVLEGGTKWQQLTISPEDAQMLESRGFSILEICMIFGVPPHMIGHTEKTTSWGSGLEQQNLGFLQYTLRRRLKRIEQAAEKQLLTPADRAKGLRVEFNLEGLLRADSAGRASFYRELSSIGAITINEIRRKEGLPPIPGGDVPRMQSQNIPITQTAGSPALAAPDGGENAAS